MDEKLLCGRLACKARLGEQDINFQGAWNEVVTLYYDDGVLWPSPSERKHEAYMGMVDLKSLESHNLMTEAVDGPINVLDSSKRSGSFACTNLPGSSARKLEE